MAIFDSNKDSSLKISQNNWSLTLVVSLLICLLAVIVSQQIKNSEIEEKMKSEKELLQRKFHELLEMHKNLKINNKEFKNNNKELKINNKVITQNLEELKINNTVITQNLEELKINNTLITQNLQELKINNTVIRQNLEEVKINNNLLYIKNKEITLNFEKCKKDFASNRKAFDDFIAKPFANKKCGLSEMLDTANCVFNGINPFQ